MKKSIIVICISVMIMFVSAIPAAASEVASSGLKQTQGNPTYTNKARYSDEGMESDRIYTFTDGEMNPEYGKPILMINGTFYANTPIIRKYNTLLVPLRTVAEALGADVNWSEEDKAVTIQYDDLKIVIKKGRYEAYEVFTGNTEDIQGYLEPTIMDGRFYVSVLTIVDYFNLDIGYINGNEIFIGTDIATNPIVWLDSPVTQDLYEKAAVEEFQKLQIWLAECLKYAETEFSGTDYEEQFKMVTPQFKKDAENMKYIGQAGRYALYKCSNRFSYVMLVDMYTHDIYVHKSGNGYELIFHADANGYNLFRNIYLAE